MKKIKKKVSVRKNSKVTGPLENSAGYNPIDGVFGNTGYGTTAPNSMPFQLSGDNNYNPLTLNRILLSYAYMTHGIIQTFIDQPVEDAFRGGIEIDSDELDEDDLKLLADYLEVCGVIKAVKDSMRWAKLYGGAGLIINTDQDPTKPFDLDSITEESLVSFIAADRWELTLNYLQAESVPCPYSYYGQPINKSRVLKVLGKDAPSYIRSKLQGWGMSELERVIRPLNSYVKNEDVIYELLDEAKIDIWHIENFNSQMLSNAAMGKTNRRLEVSTMLKNYHRALVMDKNDEYEQKQLSFAGLPEILNQNRIGAAAAVRMPMAKLFGLSAAGFNSGEDDIENYNALIESEVRAKAREVLLQVLPIACRQLFGFSPELTFNFKPLRVLSAEQEENVNTQKFNRLSALYSQGMLTGEEYAAALKKEGLFTMITKVAQGIIEPTPPAPSVNTDIPQMPVKEKKS